MVITKEVDLPTKTDLDVQEINLSISTLMSAAVYIGKKCECVNNEYMLCRQETNDPRACLTVGKAVTACSLGALRQIKAECLKEFNQYANCIDKSSGDYSYRHCRKTQAVFDNCMQDKLCMERPHFGYFCRARVHSSPTLPPKEPPCPCHPKVPDATPSLPDCKPRPPARFTSRFYWLTE